MGANYRALIEQDKIIEGKYKIIMTRYILFLSILLTKIHLMERLKVSTGAPSINSLRNSNFSVVSLVIDLTVR